MGNSNCLSARDIVGINALYPFLESFDGGIAWGGSYYATSIAFGDIDGDGRDEVAVARRADSNGRVFLLDDAAAGYRELWSTGATWGSDTYATAVAFGDVDGDGQDELGYTRRSSSNARVGLVVRDRGGNFTTTNPGNSGRWGRGNYATDIAFGDADGDGRDELLVTRRAGSNSRWQLLDDMRNGFRDLASGGSGWGSGNYATAAAFGDVDADGREEFAIGRRAGANARFFVYAYDDRLARLLHEGGTAWGSGNFVESLAFGDVDGDGRDELGVARRAGSNARWQILDDPSQGFRLLRSGGEGWGSGNYATSIAFGDVDDDGRDEIAIGRRAGANARYWVLDDARGLFLDISTGGLAWGSGNFTTDVAFGDVNANGRADLGVTRRAGSNQRFSILPSGN